jgi:glc operon protein GlcG
MNLEQKRLALAGLIFLSTAIPVLALTTNNTTLDLSGARQVIAAATREAHRLNAPGGVIAVVDDGGNLIALERLDGTFAAGAHISIGKARTAVIFKRPTKVFEDLINKGRIAMTALNDFTPLQGGMPIEFNGQIVGGIGVSGAASAQQDEEIAIAGAQAVSELAMSSSPPKTISFDRQTVSAAFAKGMPLLETDDYKVHASRRTEPGLAEIHTWETDVFYVLEGSATLVTGGEAMAPKTIAPGEIRGSAIQGGESRRLVQGDVVIIPKGLPHWFKEIDQAPFLYFVVKPIAKGENQ